MIRLQPCRGVTGLRVAGGGTAVAVAALLAAGPTTLVAQASSGVGPALGTQAPPAELQDLDGNTVQLLDYVEAGKPTLLEFWATWCPLCRALQPQLDRIHAQDGDRINVVAVAVAVNENPRRILRYLEDHDPGYPFLYDARGAAVRAYAAPTTSVVVMLDAQGKVVYTGVGRDQDLVGAVEKVLAGAEP